jgi:hypothetical protein
VLPIDLGVGWRAGPEHARLSRLSLVAKEHAREVDVALSRAEVRVPRSSL